MENTPVIFLIALKLPPDLYERYRNWVREAYWPLLMKTPWLKGIDTHRIVKENPEYNRSMSIFYFESLNHLENFQNSPEYQAWMKDVEASWAGRGEMVWNSVYKLIRNIKGSGPDISGENNTQESWIRHIEGYRFSQGDEERYENWFARWGYDAFVPLLVRLPGLIEYARYKLIEFKWGYVAGLKFPAPGPENISIFTFRDLEAFEKYEKSPELTSFRAALDIYFPRGLDFKWYVQYCRSYGNWRE